MIGRGGDILGRYHKRHITFRGLPNHILPGGRVVTVDDLLPDLLADKEFYDHSGGGVTVSGGECLAQYEFVTELFRRLKEYGISCDVDTSGFAPREALDSVLPYTDVFLYDVKQYDEAAHVRCTGVSNRLILENIRYLADKGAADRRLSERHPHAARRTPAAV